MEIVRQAKLAIKQEIVQVKQPMFDTIFSQGSLKILILISILNFEIFFLLLCQIILTFQCIAGLGDNGPPAVDVQKDIEVGKRSELLNMVVEDVTEVIWQGSPVL